MDKRLRKRHDELKMTQAQLAKMVGLDRSMISKIEAGNRCSIDVGLKIAKALGVTLGELFDSDEDYATKETA